MPARGARPSDALQGTPEKIESLSIEGYIYFAVYNPLKAVYSCGTPCFGEASGGLERLGSRELKWSPCAKN